MSRTSQGRSVANLLAFQENEGGSLPPSQADIEFTIQQLLEEGVTQADIALGMPTLHKSMVRRYIQNARSRIAAAKIKHAIRLIAGGNTTIQQAAEKVNIPVADLKNALSKDRKKTGDSAIGALKSKLTKSFRSTSGTVRGNMTTTIDRMKDGEITEKVAEDIVAHIEDHAHRLSQSVKDWRRRFEAAKS
jgi:predicted DNA-binding protein (UPF0251 family)